MHEPPTPAGTRGGDNPDASAPQAGDAPSPRDAHGAGDAPRGDNTPVPGGAPNVLTSSRYLAWLYSPPHQQPVLAKLCEIEAEIAGSLRPGIDHHVAHARLQWWREECERCAAGRPVHPLTRELVKAYGQPTASTAPANVPSPLAGISGFADTAVWDLAGATFETRKELTAYCERWATAMFATVATQAAPTHSEPATDSNHAARVMQVMSDPDAVPNAASTPDETAGCWRSLGAAIREIELLTDLAREAHAGRVRVPLDELDRAGVDVNVVARPPWPAALATFLRERHKALRANIESTVTALGPRKQAEFRGLMVWAVLAWRQSARAEHALPNIISPRRYHALADGWRAWRAARRAAAGNLRLG